MFSGFQESEREKVYCANGMEMYSPTRNLRTLSRNE